MPDTERAKLITTREPKEAVGVALVMHGGAGRRRSMPVSPTQLSVLRMVPIARRIAHAGRDRLAVHRLLNSARGWDANHTPVDDARWALEKLRARYGGLPVCLVGHSLGARAALLSAAAPDVIGVVALASFVYPQDGNVDARGTSMLFVHGDADRIAPMPRAQAAAQTAASTADVTFKVVHGGKHAMLAHHRDFDQAAARFARSLQLGDPSAQP